MRSDAYSQRSSDHMLVMPGLAPGIHVFEPRSKKDVDGRDKPGHDDGTLGLADGSGNG